MIELNAVTKIYGKREHEFRALDGVSIEISPGSSVAIVGKSGSGKSTLMHVMSGLDRATTGNVIVDGQAIASMKQKTLDTFRANTVGFIFQSFFVQANETCTQNVALPLEITKAKPSERKKRVKEALDMVGLAEKADQKAKNLSGGQKQRLAIARAIVGKPKIIFADEPTGNLDSTTGAQVEDLLFELNKKTGSTLIMVTHDEDLAKRCDRQITIRDGQVIADTAGQSNPAQTDQPQLKTEDAA
ncbi:ABC transporter ATP-binding protein [Candidatus Saccharibacteria bacterium]|nr:MAG: ABC transporter ATP-binding protein [Candidatus Saccharibacteria bacterium]